VDDTPWFRQAQTGDYVDVAHGHYYCITRIRHTAMTTHMAWQRVHRQTLQPTRHGSNEHLLRPYELAEYVCQNISQRNGHTVYQVEQAPWPEATDDLF